MRSELSPDGKGRAGSSSRIPPLHAPCRQPTPQRKALAMKKSEFKKLKASFRDMRPTRALAECWMTKRNCSSCSSSAAG